MDTRERMDMAISVAVARGERGESREDAARAVAAEWGVNEDELIEALYETGDWEEPTGWNRNNKKVNRSAGSNDPCTLVAGLRWKTTRVSAPWLSDGFETKFAPVARKRLVKIIKAFGLRARPPRAGREMLLGTCGDRKIWVENRAGKFEITARERQEVTCSTVQVRRKLA